MVFPSHHVFLGTCMGCQCKACSFCSLRARVCIWAFLTIGGWLVSHGKHFFLQLAKAAHKFFLLHETPKKGLPQKLCFRLNHMDHRYVEIYLDVCWDLLRQNHAKPYIWNIARCQEHVQLRVLGFDWFAKRSGLHAGSMMEPNPGKAEANL
jgi:hypothetical protein